MMRARQFFEALISLGFLFYNVFDMNLVLNSVSLFFGFRNFFDASLLAVGNHPF